MNSPDTTLYAAIRDALRGHIPDVNLTEAATIAADAATRHHEATYGTLHLPTVIPTADRGPALVYIHTDGQTMTDVDRVAIHRESDPFGTGRRERAISRALITEALRLLDESEQQ